MSLSMSATKPPAPGTASVSTSAVRFVLREGLDTDRAFVADAWLNTLRASNQESKRAEWHNFRAAKSHDIDGILDDKATKVRVAGPPDDDVTIYGFLVHRPPDLLHMLFVKKPFRLNGIANALLSGLVLEGATLTHWTRDMEHWLLDKYSEQNGYDGRGRAITRCKLKYDPNWREGMR